MLTIMDTLIALFDGRRTTTTTTTTTKRTRGDAAAHLVDLYGLKGAVAILLAADRIK